LIRFALARKKPAFGDGQPGLGVLQAGQVDAAGGSSTRLWPWTRSRRRHRGRLYDHAGDVAYRLGNRDKAKRPLTQALEKATRKNPLKRPKRDESLRQGKTRALKNGKNPPSPAGQGVDTTTQPAKNNLSDIGRHP